MVWVECPFTTNWLILVLPVIDCPIVKLFVALINGTLDDSLLSESVPALIFVADRFVNAAPFPENVSAVIPSD